MINKVLLINIALMLSFGVILAYFNFLFNEEHIEDYTYVFEGSETARVQAFKSFGSFFLLNNSFIPLDLAVGLEMGKFMYIYFLEGDLQMTVFDEDKRDLVSCSVKNFNLHEDLAQLDYMFCDKTGTLTQNELIFKAFKIVGSLDR
jgi:phospholipid-translocating ATPase